MKAIIFDLQRFAVISNYISNTLVSGTNGHDSIRNEGKNVTITSGTGNDTIFNAGEFDYDDRGHNVSVNTNEGDDSIYNRYSYHVTITSGNGNDSIYNEEGYNVIINAGADNDSIYNSYGGNVTINAGAGDDYIYSSSNDSVTIDAGAGNDSIYNSYGDNVTIISGAGKDTIYSYGSNVLLDAGAGDDSISFGGENVTVTGGAGNDTIISNNATNVLFKYTEGDGNDRIEGMSLTDTLEISSSNGKYSTQTSGEDLIVTVGDGKITLVGAAIKTINASSRTKAVKITGNKLANKITGGTGNDTLNGGKGNDTLTGGKGNDVFVYASGDGNDLITDFSKGDTLQISSGSYSSTKSGKNIIVTVGMGKITLQGAASLSAVNIDGKKAASWKLSGTTATYGTAIKITGVKSLDGISLSGKVVTVAASSLNKSKVTLSGNGYTLKLADDVTKTSNKKAWSLSGTTATYKQTTAAGYKLASDSKSITYTKKATKTLVTLKGVKSINDISINGKVITVSKAALGTSKVTVSDGYTLALADDVTKTSNKKAWSFSNSTATYKQTTAAGYKLAGDSKSITYTKKTTKTLATINGVKSTKGFTIEDKTIKLATSSLSKNVSVSGSYAFEFASDYKNAKITGSSSDDTITSAGQNITIKGGKGNDSLTGGKGKDTFIYAQGDGNDVITNYDEADRISIESGAVDVSTSNNDIVFTVGDGKIIVQKGKGKTITYFAGDEIRTYRDEDVLYNAKGTAATLKDTYSKKIFEPSNYIDYPNLASIDASAVQHDMNIIGNDNANRIIGTENDDTIKGGAGKDMILGGDGNDELYGEKGNDSLVGGAGEDSLWGGTGSDTLTGGEGNDIFFYDSGDGNDTIADYSPGLDKVMILSGVNVGSPTTSSSDVTFKIGNGQILFKNCASKHIELVDNGGNILKQYNP